jgi:hypothetical protein
MIEGRVTDSQELTLPAATVEVQDSQGTTIKKIVGRYDGSYRVADVPIGTYTVQFSHDGFQSVRKDAVVAAGRTVTLDAALPPQALNSTVGSRRCVDNRRQSGRADWTMFPAVPSTRTQIHRYPLGDIQFAQRDFS